MSKQVTLDSWTFGLIPVIGGDRHARIVALFGTAFGKEPKDDRPVLGTDRIVALDIEKSIATTDTGIQYVLGTPDNGTTIDGLQKAIARYSR